MEVLRESQTQCQYLVPNRTGTERERIEEMRSRSNIGSSPNFGNPNLNQGFSEGTIGAYALISVATAPLRDESCQIGFGSTPELFKVIRYRQRGSSEMAEMVTTKFGNGLSLTSPFVVVLSTNLA